MNKPNQTKQEQTIDTENRVVVTRGGRDSGEGGQDG